MSRSTAARTVFALALAAASARGQTEVTAIQLPAETTVEASWYADLSGDGRADLVIAASRDNQEYSRSLRVHFAQATRPRFRQEPDLVTAIPNSVSTCAVGDVHPDPGNEVIWFGARGAYLWRPGAKASDATTKLVAGEFLYQYPHPSRVLSWQQGVIDLNGDGLVDLVLPSTTGYCIGIQTRKAGTSAFTPIEVRLPPTAPDARREAGSPVRGESRGGRSEVGLSLFSADAQPRSPLVAVTETVPAPQFHDWDGDGKLDLLAKQGEQVFVWLAPCQGASPRVPDRTLPFPLREDQTRFDPRFSASLTDYTADRRVDAVLVAKDGKSDTLRTQIMFFPQKDGDAPLFAAGVPGQLLILAGFTSPPEFTDIDGDGTPDLSIQSWRLDTLDQLTSSDRKLDIDIYVYLNKKGRFSRRPDLSHRTTLDGELLQRGGDKLSARFLGDVTGDGVSELLVRDRPERLRLHMLRKRGGKLTLLPKPIWECSISKDATVAPFPSGSKRRGLFVHEERQVLVVMF